MGNGLITKNTDLKSLKYGSMPLGSDKPYVTKDIGQAPSSQIGLEFQSRVDDTSRIAQMLVNKPGLKYLFNEALLQQVNVADKIKNRGTKSVAQAVLKQAGSTLLTTVKIAGSTLAQVPVNGTGTHFLKGFRTDTYLQPSGPGNNSAFASFFGAGGVEGAPYALRGEVVPTNVETQLLGKYSQYDYDDYLNVATGSNQAKLNAQAGAPITVIPSGSGIRQTTLTPNTDSDISSNLSNAITYFENTTPENIKLIQEDVVDKYDSVGTYINAKTSVTSSNGNITKESRVRLGDQGARSTNQEYQAARKANQYWFRSDKNPLAALEVDKINALAPNDGKLTKNGSTSQGGETDGRDLVKFRFHILTPDGKEKVLYFRAFLDSFADNYSGQWNPVKYLGRAEDFQIYGGFQRKISLSFKIAAATRSEMEPIYQKMIWLASATAPTYANGGQFMRGTITKITLGDYIYELPGVLNSVNYTWNTEYPWEIAMVEPEQTGADDFQQELPMVMDCSIDFTPIHSFTPTTGLREYITTRLTERNKRGIPDIDNATTGIQPTVTK